ncbi:ParB-like nuclease [Escherichia coli]|nr:ParB-like nuclease [Escherichia coli]
MGNSVTLEQVSDILIRYLRSCDTDEDNIKVLNHLLKVLHQFSPFIQESVDCVLWVRADDVIANDYNPNVMAPSEQKLLKQSLEKDGFTQPVVMSEEKEHYLVVDGYHRQLLGRRRTTDSRLKAWLPVTCIRQERKGAAARIAATIRHNRARVKH